MHGKQVRETIGIREIHALSGYQTTLVIGYVITTSCRSVDHSNLRLVSFTDPKETGRLIAPTLCGGWSPARRIVI